MTRPMASATAAAAAARVVRPVILVEADFLPEPLRLWSGLGPLTWDDRLFTGAGSLLGASGVDETTDTQATGVSFSLSSMPPQLLDSLPNPSNFQGRPGRMWLALLTEAGAIDGEPVQVLGGRMDVLSFSEGESVLFNLSVESRLADLERPRVRRYTDRDQQAVHAGDRCFEFVPSLQDDEIVWGRG
jgi:hypothetical protein